MEKGARGLGGGLGTPLPGVDKGPLLCRHCSTHPTLLLAGFGHQGAEPTMLHPSLRTSLCLLILTGECCVGRCVQDQALRGDAPGQGGGKGQCRGGAQGGTAHSRHVCLSLLMAHGLMPTPSYGGVGIKSSPPSCPDGWKEETLAEGALPGALSPEQTPENPH